MEVNIQVQCSFKTLNQRHRPGRALLGDEHSSTTRAAAVLSCHRRRV